MTFVDERETEENVQPKKREFHSCAESPPEGRQKPVTMTGHRSGGSSPFPWDSVHRLGLITECHGLNN